MKTLNDLIDENLLVSGVARSITARQYWRDGVLAVNVMGYFHVNLRGVTAHQVRVICDKDDFSTVLLHIGASDTPTPGEEWTDGALFVVDSVKQQVNRHASDLFATDSKKQMTHEWIDPTIIRLPIVTKPMIGIATHDANPLVTDTTQCTIEQYKGTIGIRRSE